MDYISIYKQIISQARLKEKDRICDNVYLEEHHIVPRCMGGLNIASNLVFLTAREHFICHWLLFKKYRSSDLAYAFYSMVNGPLVKNGKRSLNPSSICFAIAKQAHCWANSNKKKCHSDEVSFDLPEEWQSLRIDRSYKGTVVLLNINTQEYKRFSCNEAKDAIKSGEWKNLLTGKRKIFRLSNPQDFLFVEMGHPLLLDRSWEFAAFKDPQRRCYIVENDQHYRWLIDNLTSVPAGYHIITGRYTNVKTRKVEKLYFDDPLTKDNTRYISVDTKGVNMINLVTGEKRRVYECEPEYSNPQWDRIRSNKGKVCRMNSKMEIHYIDKNELCDDEWFEPQLTKSKTIACVNKKGEVKQLPLDKPINTDDWSVYSQTKSTYYKVLKYAIEPNKKLVEHLCPVSNKKSGSVKRNVHTGEVLYLDKDDPRYSSNDWKGTKAGRINLRNQMTGEIRVVDVDDPIRLNSEWQPLSYKKSAYKNVHTGEVRYLSIDDPLLKGNEWVSTSKGWSTFRNIKTGEIASYGKDDPRRLDPDWQSIYKGCNDHVPDKICPHCGTVCRHGKGYTRWHGDNCKQNPNKIKQKS